jgi:hypothetical protein
MSHLLFRGSFFLYSFRHPKIRRAAWVAAAFWGLDILVLAFFWLPTALHHHQLEGEINGYRRAERAARESEAEAERYGRLKTRVQSLEAKWEVPATQSSLIESMDGLAVRLGLKILSRDFDAPNGGPRAFRQTLTLLGSYTSLRRFLDGLEDLSTLTVVQQVQIESPGEDSSNIRATLRLSTFLKSPDRGMR